VMASSANVELVRSILAPWARGDLSSAEWAHPQIDFVWADGPDRDAATGVAAMAKLVRKSLTPWEHASIEVEECRELKGDRVLALVRRSGRGKRSGVDLQEAWTEGALLFQIGGGQVTGLVVYWDREQALTDLGLAPEADSNRS
jgi:ketosteroid isomerase-like protein